MFFPRVSVTVMLLSLSLGQSTVAGPLKSQALLTDLFVRGHNELYVPDPKHPVPGKIPFKVDETVHYFAKYINGSENGFYRRASCPALNILANRGYINRSGRNITYEEIAQASRKVWNFGDDNIILALEPSFAAHEKPAQLDLDMFADDAVQHITNCPAAPTRNDREIGDNVNLNMTLFESLLTFSKDQTTLTMEDAAEHHHLRHNQSRLDNPRFRFGNQDAACTIAQYANIFGVIGRIGPNGLNTLFIEDLRAFYVKEDLPVDYGRREFPFYSAEANSFIDRMAHHIGFQIQRPWPENDQDGRDVEPVKAKFELSVNHF